MQQEYLAFPELGLALDFSRVPDARRNPAARLALAWWFLTDGRGARALVVLPYKDQLELFARYLQQLVLESLGKAFNALGTWCSSVGPLFGCIPVTGSVARSVANVRFGARTPAAGLVHSRCCSCCCSWPRRC